MENCQYEVVIDNERPINKPIVALTKCRIKFGDRDNLRQCVEEIRKSDLRLSLRPEEDVNTIGKIQSEFGEYLVLWCALV